MKNIKKEQDLKMEMIMRLKLAKSIHKKVKKGSPVLAI
jgi:hypothetical protein